MIHALAHLQQAFDEEALARTAIAQLRRAMRWPRFTRADLAWSLGWLVLALACTVLAAPRILPA